MFARNEVHPLFFKQPVNHATDSLRHNPLSPIILGEDKAQFAAFLIGKCSKFGSTEFFDPDRTDHLVILYDGKSISSANENVKNPLRFILVLMRKPTGHLPHAVN